MLETIMYWLVTLTMEELFILTGIGVVILGAGLGLFIGWIFDNENEGDEDD